VAEWLSGTVDGLAVAPAFAEDEVITPRISAGFAENVVQFYDENCLMLRSVEVGAARREEAACGSP
jgi:hypothetical protein